MGAVRYAVKLPDGMWLDNEYHKRVSRCGSKVPQDRSDTARLFASASGARNSLGRIASPSIRALLPEHLRDYHRPTHDFQWTDETRTANREFWRAVKKVYKFLKGQAYWDTLAKDGYILTQFNIKEIP